MLRTIVEVDAMKSHSWNRREFSVTPNGYFTVLRSTGWFSTVRLPGVFQYRIGLSDVTEFPQAHEYSTENPTAPPLLESTSMPDQNAFDHAGIQETAILSQSMIPSTQDHCLMRTALIILAAAAISFYVLWLAPFTIWVGSSQP
jgi:hypothetical protein